MIQSLRNAVVLLFSEVIFRDSIFRAWVRDSVERSLALDCLGTLSNSLAEMLGEVREARGTAG